MTADDQGEPYGYQLHDGQLCALKLAGAFRVRSGAQQVPIVFDLSPAHNRSHWCVCKKLCRRRWQSVTVFDHLMSCDVSFFHHQWCQTAYNKKLAWLMDRERGRRRSTATADQSSVCQSCHKGAQGILSRSLTDCHVCGQLFCSKCIVERKLIVDMHASQLTPRALPFCFACVLRAKQLSSTDLMLTSDSKKQ